MHTWLLTALIAALVVAVVVRRLRGEPLNARDLWSAPVILTAIGGMTLYRAHGVTPADLVWTTTGGALGLALGALRGSTITLFTREGVLWQRYTWRTIAVMVASFAFMAGFGLLARHFGMHPQARPTQLSIGIGFLGEATVVYLRALGTKTPFAPDRG